jgi:hypothetical protein
MSKSVYLIWLPLVLAVLMAARWPLEPSGTKLAICLLMVVVALMGLAESAAR